MLTAHKKDDLKTLFNTLLDELLVAPKSVELRTYKLKELEELSGIDTKVLMAACQKYEETKGKEGLRCLRMTPGLKNSPFLVAPEWFLAWRDASSEAHFDKP